MTAWERLSRDAGVVAGRREWDRLLSVLRRTCDEEAERAVADPDAPEWKAERTREEAARARALRDFVLGLIDDLAGAATPKGWAEHSAWARRCLTESAGFGRNSAPGGPSSSRRPSSGWRMLSTASPAWPTWRAR